MSNKLIVTKEGHVLTIGINRPEYQNLVDMETIDLLQDAYTQLDKDPELRCGIVYAVGKDFCLGADIPNIIPTVASKGPSSIINASKCNPLRNLEGKFCSKPIIVAVQGRCYTTGLELLLAADIGVAAEDAIFRQLEVTRGIMAYGGGVFRLPQMIGWHNAMRYLLTGDAFDAQMAYRYGLVQEITAVGEQLNKAMEIANKISQQAPLAVQASLLNARSYIQQSELEAIADMVSRGLKLLETQDVQEGIMSLIEKRKPMFKGC